MHIQFATSADIPHLTTDDQVAARALTEHGARVAPIVWTEGLPADVRGVAAPDAVVIRSCWDYHLRPGEFRAWLDELERRRIAVINSPNLVRWNLHKSYLTELAAAGVPTVPTILSRGDDRRTLGEMLDEAGWEEAVVKPAVSLNAHETWRVMRSAVARFEARFTAMRSAGDVLVQEFIQQVTTDGEWSLVFVGHEFSHGVRKRAKQGDFRVQIEHGGSAVAETPPQRLIDDAARVIAALPEPPVYCRVDGVLTPDAFAVMEVECIDPVLFFELHAPAAALFAAAVLDRLGR